MIVVCGGGIAGLGFAISYVINGGKEEIVILERGKDVQSRAGEYSHSLVVREDLQGTDSVRDLGLYDELKALTTPTRGFFLARAGNPIRLAMATEWFGRQDLRLFRFDLWHTMVKRVESLHIPIRWGHSAVGYSERGVHVETDRGLEYLPANLVIVADGARSPMRAATMKQGLNFLNTAGIGAVIEGKLPDPLDRRHGLTIGDGCCVFSAQETAEKILLTLSFTVDRELDRHKDEEWIKSKVKSYIPQFPTLEKELFAMLDSENTFVVNCRDRFPLKGFKPLIFLGDASHAVSPFSGAGANMALVDGAILGKAAALQQKKEVDDIKNDNFHENLQNEFVRLTFKKWEAIVWEQRKRIGLCHSTTLRYRGFRYVLLRSLPLFLSPSYKIPRYVVCLSLLIGVAALVVQWAGFLTLKN